MAPLERAILRRNPYVTIQRFFTMAEEQTIKAEEQTIKIRLGYNASKEFTEYWNEAVQSGEIPADFQATFKEGGKPPAGLGFPIPPEMLMAFGKGVATGIGTGLGALIWNKLKSFFEAKPQFKQTTGVIKINDEPDISFAPTKMADVAPAEVKKADSL
jgi:hypothetical protein